MIESLQQKNESIVEKKHSPTHSDSDLSDKFELESEGLQEKATACVLLLKVACHDQRSL